MIEPLAAGEPDAAALEIIYRQAPRGALMVAGIALGVVFALWLAFYLCIFLQRGLLQ